VFAGLRNPAKAAPLREAAAKENLPVEVIELDVASSDSVARAFEAVRKHGPVDVLVNNAGIGGATPLEFVPEDEHRQIFETNYFGSVRCIQAVLPEMRERGAGTLVNISSMTGRIATPNQIPYSASKFAIECLSEALAVEVRRFGIRVLIVEPGVVMTSIFDNAKQATRYDRRSPYQQMMRRNGKVYIAGFRRAVQPEQVAETILAAIHAPEYKLRWPVGSDALGFAAGRPKISDEDFIALGDDMEDAEYNARYRRYFGIEL
jgi:NAD(P)-dependent dehydrogenase (short-subunit alcohol dehydrogenase family)